ncbi:MAG: hypothetical protein OSA42_01555 [Porticoccaceae bacterium]|nr:hypothetical protein [Porticoccaceae bacterium]
MKSVSKLHLAFILLLFSALLVTYQHLDALPALGIATLVCIFFIGRSAAAIMLFVGIVLGSIYRLGIGIDISSIAFVAFVALAYSSVGHQSWLHRIDNLGQGAVYAGWLGSLLWLMALAADFTDVASITGSDIVITLSPLLYGYALQGVCVMGIKSLESNAIDGDAYIGK